MTWLMAIAALCQLNGAGITTVGDRQVRCQQWYVHCIEQQLNEGASRPGTLPVESEMERQTRWEGPLKTCVTRRNPRVE